MNISAKALLTICILMLLSTSVSSGQDEPKEQRIKVIVSDKEGEKVMIDTVIKGRLPGDTVIMRDGNCVRIKGNNDTNGQGRLNSYTITTTTSGSKNGKKGIRKEITIVSSDKDEDLSSAGNGHKIAVREDLANQSAEASDSISALQQGGKEMTKYIIRKNGMVITIEGTDYEKVRILQEEIENLLKTREEFRKERSE